MPTRRFSYHPHNFCGQILRNQFHRYEVPLTIDEILGEAKNANAWSAPTLERFYRCMLPSPVSLSGSGYWDG